MRARIGVAGWSIPAALAECFSSAGSHLERYAATFDSVEINSSFYRPHRRQTYARWAVSVGPDFRFAVKLPKAITHERRLVDAGDLITRFAGEVGGLGDKRGPILVQLPPSLTFVAEVAERFFTALHAALGEGIVCEPRHASWFSEDGNALLAALRIARVAADPAPVPTAGASGGWRGLVYARLHGSPLIYRSSYDGAAIDRQAQTVAARAAEGVETWTIYDNTAAGAAMVNALSLRAVLSPMESPPRQL